MKYISIYLILLAFTSLASAKGRHKRALDAVTDTINEYTMPSPVDNEVCFSPEGHCDIKLWKFIQTAQKSLDIAVYDLTNDKIAHEMLVASKKIPLRVLVDRRQSKGEHSLVSLLVKAGASVRYGSQRGIMHNKFTLVDEKRVETGSFNYTDGASFKNNENQIYLSTPEVVKKYHDRFEQIWAKGTPIGQEISRKSE